MMAILMLALLFPLMLIYLVVSERTWRRADAVREVSAQWGDAQTVVGPILSVEFRTTMPLPEGKTQSIVDTACFLPTALQVEGEVTPEVRRRGLFEVVVYRSRLKLTGRFTAPTFTAWNVAPSDVIWSNAVLSLGISDPRGLTGNVRLAWNGSDQKVVPGTPDLATGQPGVSASVRVPVDAREIPFEISLEANGTREFRVVPAGDTTAVTLRSTWPHPSFVGAPLPHQREISDRGFSASWDVPYYGRSFAPAWSVRASNRDELKQAIEQSAFGAALIHPVDIYQQSERAVKYSVLFIVMTFVIAFLWEITHGTLVHPIQYLFIGFALCVFYLLLMAFSEQIGFDRAYILGAAATLGLIAWYWSWVIRSGTRHGLLMALVLSGLYGYLYLLLRAEDYALLAGAIGLFVMLAIVMYLTRHVDWYTLRIGGGVAGKQD